MAKLQKTSLQLSTMVLNDMGHWPGLTRSEALRLSVERGHYLSCLNAENVAAIAEEYAPILREALEDLDYEDYRLAARSLPQIVAGFFSEVLSEESCGRSWRCELGGHEHQLDPKELVNKLEALNAVQRIGILDCIVSERFRGQAKVIEREEANQPSQNILKAVRTNGAKRHFHRLKKVSTPKGNSGSHTGRTPKNLPRREGPPS